MTTIDEQLLLDFGSVPALRALPAQRSRDDYPRVSLRLLMALSGRCCCDDCLIGYRRGDLQAGIVTAVDRHLHTVEDG